MAKENPPDFNDAKATFHRDSAAVIGVAFGLVIAALAIAFAVPSVQSPAALYGLGVIAFALVVVLGLAIWKMLEYDARKVGAAQKKQKT
ncbi:MAG: hypothetical protein JRN11_00345 [Nitrososphaerota archaeon]|nr:hypothetical protein [Nitrososphaerota archaeon]MDG7013842.1 hypothetical protein [Nitrososphaerota archaeon]MDG7025185.1 hypothetical protein [Nitrososphaerota archaeon]